MREYIIRQGIITKDILGQAVSEHFNISYGKTDLNAISQEVLALIPEAISKKHRIFAFSHKEEVVSIGTDDPRLQDDLSLKKMFGGKKLLFYYFFPEDVDSILHANKQKLEIRFAKLLATGKVAGPTIVEEILGDAVMYNASDVHFEPNESGVRVRFRIDGQLKEMLTLPTDTYQGVLRVIKNRAGLATDEHQKAQDGAIRLHRDNVSIDLRISIIPAIDGEKVVIRILAEYVKNLSFESLGMSAENEAMLMKIAKNPFGLILTVGPTGSGKTTTLYSLIRALNKPEINITTIEDPIEYKVEGVNHIQVNEKADLTFTKALRSIVRQDPNIIFVGEIRDRDTAEIAANAALTGHLVLSTFHANDAATAFPRLLDMGIEPFLLSSTLEMVVGQRLVRKICKSCRYSEDVKIPELKKTFDMADAYFSEKQVTLYRGKGCDNCNNTGYSGRIGIYELVFSTPELQSLLLKSPSTSEVWSMAKKQGAKSMFEDGLVKVRNGVTTLDELLRVAKPTPSDIYKK